MIKIVILTGNSHRHYWFADYFEASKTVSVELVVFEECSLYKIGETCDIEKFNLYANERSVFEKDYFQLNGPRIPSARRLCIENNSLNKKSIVTKIKAAKADFIVVFGCTIIGKEIIESFKNRIINLHMGHSPQRRGSACIFHAVVNEEFKYIASTVMLLNEKIDEGDILCHVRIQLFQTDNPHTIGARLIKESAFKILSIISKGIPLTGVKQNIGNTDIVYKRKDFTVKLINKMYEKFGNLDNKLFPAP